MRVIASAPGKVFVTGEYAVVRGGAAIVAALDRRVTLELRSGPGSGHLVCRSGDIEHSTRIDRFDGPAAPQQVRFLVAAAQMAAREVDLRGVDVRIEARSDLDPGATKRGLGGSAAISAAAVTGIYGIAGRDTGEASLTRRVTLAVSAHRTTQGGGSGADVVAATVGGLVWTNGSTCEATSMSDPPPPFERLELPAQVSLEVVATNQPASTGARVARFLAMCHESSIARATLDEWQKGMELSVEELRAACRESDASRAIAGIRFGARQLAALAPIAGIRILTRELRKAALVASGAAVKPSGAGGGDCAIALVASTECERLRESWRAAGLEPLETAIDRRGAVAEIDAREDSSWQ